MLLTRLQPQRPWIIIERSISFSVCKRLDNLCKATCIQKDVKRGIRVNHYWISRRRALPYPPNFTDHHIFLPSIKQALEEVESIRNPVNINDVGLTHEEYVTAVTGSESSHREASGKSRTERLKKNTKEGNTMRKEEVKVNSKEQLVKLIDVAVKKKELHYNSLNEDWMKSIEGKQQLQNIAHHYHVFRDLFSSPSMTPVEGGEDSVPKVSIVNFKPLPDHIMTDDLYKEWYPGSIRYKDPVPRQIYHFTPHVPIDVEFCVPETLINAWEVDKDVKNKDINPDSLISSPVFRGNIVTPLYAAAKPTVVVDTRTSKGTLAKDEVEVGSVKILREKGNKNLYSLCLFNLDTIFGDDKPVCHWMISNIGSDQEKEVVSFMPVFGIRGLGYHRYVFLLLQHDKPLSNLKEIRDYSFSERQIDPLNLIQEKKATPVGLSWFQTTFDDYSQHVMHHELNIRSPFYEYIEEPEPKIKQVIHPFGAPFNYFLDHFRDKKEINRYTLLERLKSVDPFDYTSQFKQDPLPNAYLDEIRDIEPSWMQSVVWKKRNRIGPYRYLRPHSSKIPLDNNADLDKPIFPAPGLMDIPNKYPPNVKRWKPLRETKWATPPNEWPIYSVGHPDMKDQLEGEKKEED